MNTFENRPPSIAVVGAGIAGLACAMTLAEAGLRVTLFDKGRSPGGRVATRRGSRGGDGQSAVSFDHGAQFATARGAGFSALLEALQAEGTVAPWPAAGRRNETAFVGVPGMSALPRALTARLTRQGVAIQCERYVSWLHEGGAIRHWPAADAVPGSTHASGGVLSEKFDAVLLALPAPQAAALLSTRGHRFGEQVSGVAIAPCWAVMASFAAPVPAADVIRPANGPLVWIARNSNRPGHNPVPDAWVLHASAFWSRAHLDDDADSVIEALMAAFGDVAGTALPVPASVAAHRWRYALVETPLGRDYLWDSSARIGVCGDWCLGARVEAAYDSGVALARAVLEPS